MSDMTTENKIKGKMYYRNLPEVVIPLLLLTHIVIQYVVPGKMFERFHYLAYIIVLPFFLLTLSLRIPVHYTFEQDVLTKKIWKFSVKKIDLSKPYVLYHLSTRLGSAIFVDKDGEHKIIQCKSIIEILIYRFLNRNNCILIPFDEKDRAGEFIAFLNGNDDRLVTVNGGFLKLLSNAQSTRD